MAHQAPSPEGLKIGEVSEIRKTMLSDNVSFARKKAMKFRYAQAVRRGLDKNKRLQKPMIFQKD